MKTYVVKLNKQNQEKRKTIRAWRSQAGTGSTAIDMKVFDAMVVKVLQRTISKIYDDICNPFGKGQVK